AQYRNAPQLTPTGVLAAVAGSIEIKPMPMPSIVSMTSTISAAATPASTAVQLKVARSKKTTRRPNTVAIIASWEVEDHTNNSTFGPSVPVMNSDAGKIVTR